MNMNAADTSRSVFLKRSAISASLAVWMIATSLSAQKPPLQNFTLEEFIRASDLIIVGRIESQFWVVDPEKGGVKMTKRPDGKLDIEFPLLQKDYVKGIENNLGACRTNGGQGLYFDSISRVG